MSHTTGDSRPAARVAVLRRKGKFLVAESFFEPGPQVAVSRDRKADVGDLVVVSAGAANRRGSRRAVISRRLGRPDVARDVIEALMLHRGLRRSFDPAVEHDARDVARRRRSRSARDAISAICRRSRSTPRARVISTTRSAPSS